MKSWNLNLDFFSMVMEINVKWKFSRNDLEKSQIWKPFFDMEIALVIISKWILNVQTFHFMERAHVSNGNGSCVEFFWLLLRLFYYFHHKIGDSFFILFIINGFWLRMRVFFLSYSWFSWDEMGGFFGELG